jgi:hypothetical protein
VYDTYSAEAGLLAEEQPTKFLNKRWNSPTFQKGRKSCFLLHGKEGNGLDYWYWQQLAKHSASLFIKYEQVAS